MKRSNIFLVVIFALAFLSLMLWTARTAKETSDNILDSFQTVDKSLKKSFDSLEQKNDSLLKTIPLNK